MRIGPKYGFCTLIYQITQVEAEAINEYEVISLSELGGMFGISFKRPSASYLTGTWRGSSSTLVNSNNYYAYSPKIQVTSTGLEIGRIYNTSGAYGSWSYGTQDGFGTITVSDVYLEEV